MELSKMSEQELLDLQSALAKEWELRATQPLVEEAKREQQAETVADISQKLAEQDTKLAPPAKPDGKVRPWKPWHPTAKDTHFYYGDLVTHDGKIWRNVVDESRKQPNVWEPGSPGIDERYWVEVPQETQPGEDEDPAPVPEEPAEQEPPAAPDGSQTRPFTWQVGKTYTKGQYITYDGAIYKMAQTHTAVDHYRPGPGLESIYQPI